jgi:hypothetical protein
MAHIDASPIVTARALNAYIREKIGPMLRKRYLLRESEKRGRWTMDKHGEQIEWRPTFKRRSATAMDVNPTAFSFPSVNRERIAKLPWRAYGHSESVNKFDRLATSGEGAFFKKVEDKTNQLTEEFVETLCDEMYNDGNASGNKGWHGLESIFAVNSTISGVPVGDPNDLYAQLYTNLGYYGGSWSTTDLWPTGEGSTEYHAWSPIVVDWANELFGTGTNKWTDNWQEACNYLLTYQGILNKQAPDVLLMNAELMRIARDSLKSIQKLEVTENKSEINIGPDGLSYNGTKFEAEYGVPADTAYAITFDKIELWSMQGQLIHTETDADISTSQDLIALDSYSQWIYRMPSALGKLYAITTPGT